MQTYTIKRCSNCSHCFKSKRSKTGYSCEMWGRDDFACDTILEGYCHKFKALPELDWPDGIFMFETEDKAKEILDKMIWIAETYAWASRADFMELINKEPSYEDTKYVWWANSLKNKTRVAHTPTGYFIACPEPFKIR